MRELICLFVQCDDLLLFHSFLLFVCSISYWFFQKEHERSEKQADTADYTDCIPPAKKFEVSMKNSYPKALSRRRDKELIPPPRQTPPAKIDYANPRFFGKVQSERRLILTGTQDPINIANPILGGKIVLKLVENDSRNVQTVQSRQAIIQTHFLG